MVIISFDLMDNHDVGVLPLKYLRITAPRKQEKLFVRDGPN